MNKVLILAVIVSLTIWYLHIDYANDYITRVTDMISDEKLIIYYNNNFNYHVLLENNIDAAFAIYEAREAIINYFNSRTWLPTLCMMLCHFVILTIACLDIQI